MSDPNRLGPEAESPEGEAVNQELGRARVLLPAELGRRARVGAKQVIRRQVPVSARQAFRIDLTSMLLAGLYTGAVFPFIQVIAREDLHASPALLALMTSAPFLGNLFALFVARAMQGKRVLPFVTYSHLGARIMILASAFAVGAWPFALVMSLCQIIGALSTPAYAHVMKVVYPDDQRGRLMSYTRAGILAAQILSTLGAGWLMDLAGYRVVFPAAAVVGICAALIFSRILPSAREEAELDTENSEPPLKTIAFLKDTFGILRDDHAYRWFALSVFTYGFGNLMTIPVIPLIQVDALHIHKSQLALMANLTQIVAILAYFFWGKFVDERSPQRAVVWNILINLLVPLNYAVAASIPGGNAWWLLPAFMVSGIVGAGIDMSYFNALLTFARPENVARYQALQSFLLGIRGTLAPFLGSSMVGWLRDHHQNLAATFWLGMIFMLAGAIMQGQAVRRQEAAA